MIVWYWNIHTLQQHPQGSRATHKHLCVCVDICAFVYVYKYLRVMSRCDCMIVKYTHTAAAAARRPSNMHLSLCVWSYIYIYIYMYMYQCICVCNVEMTWYDMGWLRLVGSLKLQVSFAKEPYTRDDILQKRPIILRSLLIEATP